MRMLRIGGNTLCPVRILRTHARLTRRHGAPRCANTTWRAFTSQWAFPDPAIPPTREELHQSGLPLLCQAAKRAQDGRVLLSGWPHDDDKFVDIVSYHEVLSRASIVTELLLSRRNAAGSPFVATLSVPGWEYVSSLWGTWAAGYASVPLALSHQTPELEHVLTDTQPNVILIGGGVTTGTQPSHSPPNISELVRAANNLGMTDRIVYLKDVLVPPHQVSQFHLGQNGIVPDLDCPALVLYTSGTTGKPKGVVSTHRNVFHQVTDLVCSWQWESTDVALHILPLHHVHGVINVLSCAAYAGARLQFRPFDSHALWDHWASPSEPRATVLMAVPTIYAKLLEAADSIPEEKLTRAISSSLRPMRLMVSGSAALPVSLSERWRNLTGHTLLERYGMTEFAMALSNPYTPKDQRQPGHVGLPLPSVEVRIVDEETGKPIEIPNTSGALQVRGPTVFQKYLNRPDATEEAFDGEGFFHTGDVAEYNAELRSYRILGRASVDILKTGGHKLSALEIERDILEHPDIAEIAVVGVPDETWGQRVGLICRLKSGRKELTLDELRTWCAPRMARYKIPSLLIAVDDIPKNAMGKVNKKNLVTLFQTDNT